MHCGSAAVAAFMGAGSYNIYIILRKSTDIDETEIRYGYLLARVDLIVNG